VIISIVAAMAENHVIGRHNKLPWHLPADLKHFKHLTLGKPVAMGRKTFESIGKPLPGRTNIVITSNPEYPADNCIIVHSLDEALNAATSSKELMVIGGASFYQQALPLADRMYLTLVHGSFAGDAYFPQYNEQEWQQVNRSDHGADERNPVPYSFIEMRRQH
jgi:dihydrofolate reductase